jgi:hypothetical protein
MLIMIRRGFCPSYLELPFIELDAWVALLEVDIGRNGGVLDHEGSLDHARDTGSSLKMADIWLYRAHNERHVRRSVEC